MGHFISTKHKINFDHCPIFNKIYFWTFCLDFIFTRLHMSNFLRVKNEESFVTTKDDEQLEKKVAQFSPKVAQKVANAVFTK